MTYHWHGKYMVRIWNVWNSIWRNISYVNVSVYVMLFNPLMLYLFFLAKRALNISFDDTQMFQAVRSWIHTAGLICQGFICSSGRWRHQSLTVGVSELTENSEETKTTFSKWTPPSGVPKHLAPRDLCPFTHHISDTWARQSQHSLPSFNIEWRGIFHLGLERPSQKSTLQRQRSFSWAWHVMGQHSQMFSRRIMSTQVRLVQCEVF